MELGTLGAVLAFAVTLEAQAAEFYEKVASLAEDPPTSEVFQRLAEAKSKRKKRVERGRREYVNEMLLEPLVGLDTSNYSVETDLPSTNDLDAARRLATQFEQSCQRFYLDAAQLITLPQLARVLRKMGQENADHGLRLESLQ